MFKKLLLLLVVSSLLALCAVSAYGATWGKLAGTVINKNTREPLPGVNIMVEGTTLGAFTDADGNYFIINVPVGVHTVRAQMMGYAVVTQTNVRVSADLTTVLDFALEEEAMVGKEVVVVAKREVINKSNTSSMKTVTTEQVETLPVTGVQDALTIQAGTVTQGTAGTMHVRGGRGAEVVFMVDGMMVRDPLTGAMDTDIPQLGTEESSMITGGFGAEYGNAQSGIVNVITKEGGDKYAGKIWYETTVYKMPQYFNKKHLIIFSLGGPEPISKYLFKAPGKLKWSASGDITPEAHGRFDGQDTKGYTLQGKLTFVPNPSYRISVGGLFTWSKYGTFSNLYKRTTFEDNLEEFGGGTAVDTSNIYYKLGWVNNGKLDSEDGWIPDPTAPHGYRFDPAYKNGKMDYIDRNGNGRWDPGEVQLEDINGNGKLDGEDLDHDGTLNSHKMLDNLWRNEDRTRQITINWTHNLSKKTFYELRLSQYMTKAHTNIEELVNEDVNMNGKLDMGEDLNNNYILDPGEDIDGDGKLDLTEREIDTRKLDPLRGTKGYDVNGNGMLDPNEDINGNGKLDNGTEDIYRDEDNDNFIDGSNGRVRWDDIATKLAYKDSDGFFKYGSALGYYPAYPRDQWHDDKKTTSSVRLDVTSQVTKRHQFKVGGEMHYYEIYNFDVDVASGGNNYGEKYTVYPNSGGFYAQDKMEFQGMIVNVGLRFDYFDANYHNYPSDITDPVIDPINGGVVKNPTSIPFKYYWSPRLGVSYPITENDILRFSYGRYFQIPQLAYAFRNLTFDFRGAFPIIGNADISPERTSAYELGVDHQIGEVGLISATGFYKDITGLVDTRQVYYTVTDWYGLYVNTDYGSVRGFEVSLAKNPANHWSASVNYTFSIAKGKSSGTAQGYLAAYYGEIEPTTESYLDWDQRHTINVTLGAYTSKDEKIFGLPAIASAGWSANLLWNFGSGMPWTLPRRDKKPVFNTERLPITKQADLKIVKKFYMKPIIPLAYLEVTNLFNDLNIVALADAEWYYNFKDPTGQYKNPTVYSTRRTANFGVGFDF